jgi:DDE superfamily endonuclease
VAGINGISRRAESRSANGPLVLHVKYFVALAEMSTVVRELSRRCESDYRIAITKKGAMTFMVFAGKFNAPVFVIFMYRLLNQIEVNVYLIVDKNPVHKSSQAKRFLAKNTKRLRLI